MSSKSKISERRFDGISGKDVRRNVGLGGSCERDGGDGVAHDGIAVEAVAGSKVCRLGTESGSPFTVRTREVDDSMEVTGGKSFRTDGSRQGCLDFGIVEKRDGHSDEGEDPVVPTDVVSVTLSKMPLIVSKRDIIDGRC